MDRQHAYAGKSPDTSSFHLGSLGNVGFPGSSPSHTVEIASHNIFSHAGGNNGVVYSPQQMCHLFPGRNPVISMPGSFESPNECVRNFSHHRNELNFNNADKKQYELDIDCIIHGEDSRTTLMIKNIPNKHSMAKNGKSSTVKKWYCLPMLGFKEKLLSSPTSRTQA
ncbi:hypothetical protein SLA2020_330630 [Shorea laevis]